MAAPRSSGSSHSTGQCARSGGAGAGRLPEVVVGRVGNSGLLVHRRVTDAAVWGDAAAGVDPLDVGGTRGPVAVGTRGRAGGLEQEPRDRGRGDRCPWLLHRRLAVLPSFACHVGPAKCLMISLALSPTRVASGWSN